jgi:4-oxalocrotonate tautomerase family enzyme
MPLVKIDLKKGKPREFVIGFMDAVFASMLDVLHIPNDDKNIRVAEFEPDFFISKPPYEYFIEIIMFAGRTKETKSKLFKAIVEQLLEKLQVDPKTVFILINEQPLENWGVRGGFSATDIQFDFKIDI